MQSRPEYEALKRELASGWNTWNTYSVLSHVLLPQGLAISLGIKEYRGGVHLREALIGRTDPALEQIHPGPRSYDGAYTELTLRWRGIELLIQSATADGDLVLLITPRANQLIPATLTVEAGLMWNRPGFALVDSPNHISVRAGDLATGIYSNGEPVTEFNVQSIAPYLAFKLDRPIVISTGRPRSLEEVEARMRSRRAEVVGSHARFGKLAEAHAALQTCLAWDTIYDPANDRVISPVSRIWNSNQGGWVLFCWDTYFAAYLASLDSKALAYANAVEITRHLTADGFVPNTANAHGFVTRDRSQPPVGSMVVRELYRRFGDRWLIEMLFDDLLRWNRWWWSHRQRDHLLSWGSNAYAPVTGNEWESAAKGVGGRFGGALESGLDNSPMYDDTPFDSARGTLALQDVGLSGLYIMDCEALADLARVLGRADEAREIAQRGESVSAAMQSLWDDQAGIYCNRRIDTGAFEHRLSPTNFYSLFSRKCPPDRVGRLLQEHFYNPAEFWGEYVLPSIARSDPAYADQSYWRGRIWAPLNFLVYLALRRHDAPQARKDLAERSLKLLLQEWQSHGHVCEHYDADTGWGTTKAGAYGADRFYHWGALLALINFIEHHHVPAPEAPLVK
jgi:putative isomerase